ncbi:hypothetical protein [Corynebacterium pelargi]|uniref:Uncharacterized protein n=1 Tax=Corynebacterium pelargi TaxID=1471400 RepID=A0A410WA63_9CORY|nr:hypothetical protein [Corynebacterium pelargi]QAU52863.1 hypothetical protein CPELA_08035 [Corynebacterium pelargi]GGG76438.1 hypothetical protein GCM10007338_12730 [Corynebacterium pelargi]
MMRKLLAGSAILVLAGCSASSDDSSAKPEQWQTTAKIFNHVLDHADEYDFDIEDASSTYDYSLVDANGDGQKELLLRKTPNAAVGSVLVFAADPEHNQAILADTALKDGVATAGGGRYSIAGTKSEHGIIASSGEAASGATTAVLYTIDGASLVDQGQWNYTAGSSGTPESLEAAEAELDWENIAQRPFNEQPDLLRSNPGDLPNIEGETGGNDAASAKPEEKTSNRSIEDVVDGRSKADFPTFSGDASSANPNYVPKTSPQFARAVYNAFILEWIYNANTTPVLEVTSPVTGQTYTMTCVQDTSVTCRGGNDAVVYIYPPSPYAPPDGVQWG